MGFVIASDTRGHSTEHLPKLLTSNLGIEADDFGYAPFNQRGGLGKVHQLFGAELHTLLTSLSDALAA